MTGRAGDGGLSALAARPYTADTTCRAGAMHRAGSIYWADARQSTETGDRDMNRQINWYYFRKG